jgi:beta-glucanase (GH16 family)
MTDERRFSMPRTKSWASKLSEAASAEEDTDNLLAYDPATKQVGTSGSLSGSSSSAPRTLSLSRSDSTATGEHQGLFTSQTRAIVYAHSFHHLNEFKRIYTIHKNNHTKINL